MPSPECRIPLLLSCDRFPRKGSAIDRSRPFHSMIVRLARTLQLHRRSPSRRSLATMTTAISKDDQVQKLRKLFASSDVPNDAKAWDQAWIDSTTPWDSNRPQPALVELLNGGHDADAKVADLNGDLVPVSSVIPKGTGTAVVPGCGRGYDAKVFAERGLTSHGVDISSNAVAAANQVGNSSATCSLAAKHSRLTFCILETIVPTVAVATRSKP